MNNYPAPSGTGTGSIQPTGNLPTSTLAVVSLCASIAGLFILPIVGSIIGIICGFMALKETRSTPPTRSGDTLAMIGIVIGFISLILWVLGILLGILFPTLCCCFPYFFGDSFTGYSGY
jgi:uncharacterized protein with PQ loop repeat